MNTTLRSIIMRVFQRFLNSEIANFKLGPIKKTKKIGILMIQGIGDVVCAFPLLESIRAAHPNARITAIMKSELESELFKGKKLVDDFLFIDPSVARSARSILRAVQAVRQKMFDSFVVATGMDGFKSPLLAALSGASERVGELRSPIISLLYTHGIMYDENEHKVESNLRLARALGVEPVSNKPVVTISLDGFEKADLHLDRIGISPTDRYIVFHLGSGPIEYHKRWPLESYVNLAESIKVNGTVLPIVVVGGKGETSLGDRLQQKTGSLIRLLAGQVDLMATAAVLQRAHLVIGADSGVMHLAKAVGASTISLFGPTNPVRTAPYPMQRVVSKGLECSPCYERRPVGCGNPVCMSSISVMDVLGAISLTLPLENVSLTGF